MQMQHYLFDLNQTGEIRIESFYKENMTSGFKMITCLMLSLSSDFPE